MGGGWPTAPDPLGELPFPVFDDTSDKWLQCAGCRKWLQVHPEVHHCYFRLKFMCQYITGRMCSKGVQVGRWDQLVAMPMPARRRPRWKAGVLKPFNSKRRRSKPRTEW